MAFTRTINVEGIETILDVPVRFNFNYVNDVAPTIVNFNINYPEGMSAYGMCDANGIVSYNVSGGIANDDLLTALVAKAKEVLAAYDTIG